MELQQSETFRYRFYHCQSAGTDATPVNFNDTLSSIAIITPVAGDLTPADDTALVR